MIGPRCGAPGPKQVARVVEALEGQTPAEGARLPMARLRKWAREGGRPEDYDRLRPLAKKVGDPWATGRRLACILVALGGGS